MASLLMAAFVVLLVVGGWVLILLPFFVVPLMPFAIVGYYGLYFFLRFARTVIHSDAVVSAARVMENGNPIVDFASYFPKIRLQPLSPSFPEKIRGRKHVGELLMAAQRGLLSEHYFLVRECYRPSGVKTVDTNNHMNSGNHTGGAFDITLCDKNGKELNLGLRNLGKLNWLERPVKEIISVEVRSNRKILHASLKKAGFVNDPLEWWSWSYGDKFWSVVKKADFAIYGELVA